jgi:hypothetical protein
VPHLRRRRSRRLESDSRGSEAVNRREERVAWGVGTGKKDLGWFALDRALHFFRMHRLRQSGCPAMITLTILGSKREGP